MAKTRYGLVALSTQKLLLFVSIENPFWISLVDGEITQEKIATILGIKPTNISNLRRTGHDGEPTIRAALAELQAIISNWPITTNDEASPHKSLPRKKRMIANERSKAKLLTDSAKSTLLHICAQFTDVYRDEQQSIRDTANILSMPLDVAQQIVDEVVYANQPFLPGICFETYALAAAFSKKYYGVYRVSIMRDERVLVSMLRIRKPIILGVEYAVPGKLHIPLQMQPGHYSVYNGFVVSRDQKIYWLFEKTVDELKDYFFIITGTEKSGDGERCLIGHYLTTGQDARRTIVSNDIFMQKVKETDLEKMEELMRTSTEIVSGDDYKRTSEKIREFGNQPDPI